MRRKMLLICPTSQANCLRHDGTTGKSLAAREIVSSEEQMLSCPGCGAAGAARPRPPPCIVHICAGFSALGFLRVDGSAGRQHRHKFLDSGRPGLGLLGVVYPVKDRIAVSTIQRFEKLARLLVPDQGRLEVGGNLCRALRRIGGLPMTVFSRAFKLPHPGREHAAHFDQLKRAGTVSFGPSTAWTTRSETDQRMVFVKTIELTVDPAVTQSCVDCLRLRNAENAGGLLCQLQPEAFGIRSLRRKPVIPGLL